jgi:3-deoxy-D-manno-octulosonic-acid transferase
MRKLYTIALRLALPLILLRLWWRGRREPGYLEGIEERFGLYSGPRPEKVVWVHAVSVGEARAAAPLVRALKEALPDHAVVMTGTTAAGRQTIKQVYGESVIPTFLPYDYPESVRSFLERFRPTVGILMETEIWPNLLSACTTYGVPVVLANARMSEKSARGYRRWRSLMAPAIRSLAAVCAQSETDATRLRELGAPRVVVTGNLKFDVSLDAAQLAAGREWKAKLGRPVLLLASTREGEEKILLTELGAQPFLTVVVPRHPQRFDEVAPMADARRSRNETPKSIYLGDTMGEMAFYYGAADVAVIGGSLLPLGGQNLIEALAVGVPVIVGPSMFNFAEATRLALKAGAAVQVADAQAALLQVKELLSNPEKREQMAAAGKTLCAAHRGATQKHLEVLMGLRRD